MDITELKPMIRSMILALGKGATEREFRRVYAEMEGESFNTVLNKYNLSFYGLMTRLPDVCRAYYNYDGEVYVERVSTEESAHMDHLTIVKKKKRRPVFKTSYQRMVSFRRTAFPATRVRNTYPNPAPHPRFQPLTPSASNSSNVSFHQHNRMRSVIARVPAVYRPITAPRTNVVTNRPPPAALASHGSERAVYRGSAREANTPPSNLVSAERAVYRGNARVDVKANDSPSNFGTAERTVYRGSAHIDVKANNPPSNLETVERVVHRPAAAERVVFKGTKLIEVSNTSAIPSTSATKLPGVGTAEKVVYRPTERVIFSEKDLIIEKIQPFTWTDTESMQSSTINLKAKHPKSPPSLSSSISTLVPSEKKSENRLNQFEDNFVEINCENIQKIDRKMGELNLIQSSEMTSEAVKKLTPKDLRISTVRQRSRLFGKAIENITQQYHQLDSDYLQSFITDKTFRIPLPATSTNPRFFTITLLSSPSPSHFTFQFNQTVLEEMSKKMKELYESLEYPEHYRVKKLYENMAVVVNNNEKWYRAEIKDFNEKYAYIVPVDSMTLLDVNSMGILTKKISIKNIYYLHKSFSTETQKSAQGCLYGIKPADGGFIWSKECCDIMQRFDRVAKAVVKKCEDGIYHMNILNFESRDNLVDLLREKGLVEFDDKWRFGNESYTYVALK